MNESLGYLLFSAFTAFVAILAVFEAKKAMEKGLTYSVLHATLITLSILAISRVWHTIREYLGFEMEWAEFVEYALNVVAYGYFSYVAYKESKVVVSKGKK
jgi:hypothetical protein